MKSTQLKELVLQSLEHERGGVLIYQTALKCVTNNELRVEWERYLEQTKTHVTALERVCRTLNIDPEERTPGCKVVRHTGQALVEAMKMALADGNGEAAQLVATDCVALAEMKDHSDWQILGKCISELSGNAATTLKEAYDRIEEEEDEHLYHGKGWGRELWLQSLGLDAVLPPPEEVANVKSAFGAAKAEKESEATRRH